MEKELILMVGPIGSGKTTFTKTLENDTSIRISQDEMGRGGHRMEFERAIHTGVPRVIIDRMNFNKDQRSRYIDHARTHGYIVTIFEMEYDYDVCVKRVMAREGHPTVMSANKELAKSILDMYEREYEAPEASEYDNYNKVEI